MIEAAIVISAFIQHWDDLAVITLLLVVNAIVGFWQENKASNAIELLKQKLALRARVLRDGKWADIPARELVPGDIVRLRLGNVVPADAVLVSGDYLLLDESALTGESLPVEKHHSSQVYSSSIIKQGEMNAVVTKTGMNTYFGRTTRLVEQADTRSHFQKAIVKIGDYLIAIAVLMVALTTAISVIRGQSFFDLLQFGLVLMVAAIPAALPAVLSVSMAVGAEALARKEAIVSKLVAIEEMTGVDVLCADKTGTITKNELTIGEVRALKGENEKDVIVFATLASREEDKDPIDEAIIAKTHDVDGFPSVVQGFKVTSFKPFDPVSKRTEATIEDISTGLSFQVTKGAPQAIMGLVEDTTSIELQVQSCVSEFASKGYRALGVGCESRQGSWRYLGVIALYDPPREDSAETIATAQSMGMDVKMITGDHIAIAQEISKEVGLHRDIVTASTIIDKPDSEAELIVERG